MYRLAGFPIACAFFVLVISVLAMPSPCRAAASDDAIADLKKVKLRTLELLVCPSGGTRGERMLERLNQQCRDIMAEPFKPLVWTDPEEEAFNQRLSSYLGRVRILARGWASESGRFYHDEQVLQRILAGLGSALDHFSADTPRPGNWYYWLMEVPDRLGSAALLIEDALPAGLRRRLEASLEYQLQEMLLNGANAAWEARNHCYLAMLQKDTVRLGKAAFRIFDTLRYGSDGGVCEDYGYLFHGRIPYAGTYGAGFVQTVSQFMFLFDDTQWSASLARRDLMANLLLEHSHWCVAKGQWDFNVRGRNYKYPGAARACLDAMLYMTRVDSSRQQELKAAAASLIAEGVELSDNVSAFADAIGNVEPVFARGFRYWYTCDLGVYRAQDYHVSFRMYSKRVQDYEFLTRKGGDGWNLAYGFTYLTRSGNELFTGKSPNRSIDYYDFQRLPGTTSRIGSHPINPTDDISDAANSLNFGRSDFSGAAGLDDGGMAAFILIPTNGEFVACKSLTFFPGGFLAMGSGIASKAPESEDKPVQTTILQWAGPKEDTPLIISGLGEVELTGTPRKIEAARWCFVDGIGVSFYEPTDIMVRRIGRLVSIWLDHGPHPVDDGYAYVLQPATTLEDIEAFTKAPTVRPLRRDAIVHAVIDDITASTAYVRFTSRTVSGTRDPRAIVYLRQSDKGAMLAVQNPLHSEKKLQISVPVAGGLPFNRIDPEIEPSPLTSISHAGKYILNVNTRLGRVYRAAFGDMGIGMRPARREDLSDFYSFDVRADSDAGKTVLTMDISDDVIQEGYQIVIEGSQGHLLKIFEDEDAMDRPGQNVVRYLWKRKADTGTDGNPRTVQTEGDFRIILRTKLKTATEYITVPRFDQQGNASYPADLPKDRNKPPAWAE